LSYRGYRGGICLKLSRCRSRSGSLPGRLSYWCSRSGFSRCRSRSGSLPGRLSYWCSRSGFSRCRSRSGSLPGRLSYWCSRSGSNRCRSRSRSSARRLSYWCSRSSSSLPSTRHRPRSTPSGSSSATGSSSVGSRLREGGVDSRLLDLAEEPVLVQQREQEVDATDDDPPSRGLLWHHRFLAPDILQRPLPLLGGDEGHHGGHGTLGGAPHPSSESSQRLLGIGAHLLKPAARCHSDERTTLDDCCNLHDESNQCAKIELGNHLLRLHARLSWHARLALHSAHVALLAVAHAHAAHASHSAHAHTSHTAVHALLPHIAGPVACHRLLDPSASRDACGRGARHCCRCWCSLGGGGRCGGRRLSCCNCCGRHFRHATGKRRSKVK